MLPFSVAELAWPGPILPGLDIIEHVFSHPFQVELVVVAGMAFSLTSIRGLTERWRLPWLPRMSR